MFSVVDAVLLNPLPFPNANRFGQIWTASSERSSTPGTSPAAFFALRRETAAFTAVEGYQFNTVNVTTGGDPEIVASPFVTPGLLRMLGVAPMLGRLLTDDDAAAAPAVLISESIWAGRLGSDPDVIGREIVLDDQPHRIVGVMPVTFRFPEGNVRIWRPLAISAETKPARVQVITVRRADVTAAEVDERLRAMSPDLRAAAAIGQAETLTIDVLLQQRFGRQSGQALWVLFGGVALVLLVACANVMNLLLARASVRAGELAVMAAVGAGTGHLVRAVLFESVVLAAGGCAAGLVLARVLLNAILGAAPANLTFLTAATSALDARAVTFAVGLAFATCVAFGVLPAWRAARVNAIGVLRQRSPSVAGSDEWWQGALVSVQLALVLVLLAGSGLLLRSFDRLVSIDPGFDVDPLSVVTLQLPAHRYGSPGVGLAFLRDLETRVESRPGVSATVSGGAPPRAGGFSFNVAPEAEGRVAVDFTGISLPFTTVSPDYFETLGIRILEGRTFSAADPPDVVIVNDVLARRFWGDTSPVGRRFRMHTNRPWQTVIGVAADVKQMGPADPMGEGMELYQPFDPNGRNQFFTLIVRSGSVRGAVMTTIKQQVWDLDPRLPIVEAATMAHRVGDAVARPRFYLVLSSAFALTGALLSAIGVYGVSSYWVSRRLRELGIRVALGASRERLIGMVVGRSVRLAALGLGVGLAAAWAGARAIEAMLFQVSSRDPMTLGAVTAVLAGLVVVGALGPAMRAARVDPMTALRAE
jgi:predicted permease